MTAENASLNSDESLVFPAGYYRQQNVDEIFSVLKTVAASSDAIRISGTVNIPQVTGHPYAYLAGGSATIDVILHVEGDNIVIDSQLFTATATASPWGDTPSSTGIGRGTVTATFVDLYLYVLFLRSSPVYLTSANNTVTLPQGYYDEFVVSTNIKTEGEVYYHHHVHSELSTNEYYEDQSPAITSVGPADNDKALQNSGCFTKPVYGTKSCGGTYHLKYTNQEGYPEHTQYHSTCDRCGYSTSDDWNQNGTKCKRTVTDYNNIVGYTTGCGITRGTVVEALIKY